MNELRINQILELRKRRRPTNAERLAAPPQPGDACVYDGTAGVIDAAFFDLQAAVDCGIVDASWYIDQDPKPQTLPTERWYSVILAHGAVLLGERELVVV